MQGIGCVYSPFVLRFGGGRFFLCTLYKCSLNGENLNIFNVAKNSYITVSNQPITRKGEKFSDIFKF